MAGTATGLSGRSFTQTALPLTRVFWKRDFPGPLEPLLEAAVGEHRRIANGAVGVLRRLRDPRERALGLSLIDGGRDPVRGVRLLKRNSEPGDFPVFKRLLTEIASDDACHHIGFSVLDVIEGIATPAAASRSVLLHLYCNGPCSACRARAVALLVRLGDVPGWLIDECRRDCVPAIVTCIGEL